jgi:hypothetical protein
MNMASGIKFPFTLDDGSLRVLIGAVAAGIPGNAANAPMPAFSTIDWTGLQHVARTGKLLGIARRGFVRAGIEQDVRFAQAAASYRREALAINGLNLATIQRLSGNLNAAGLDFVLFKGPLQQHMLYGDYFLRPSTDIDLLVFSSDFDRASMTLRQHGYELPLECQTPWWRHFLGEQHFFYPDAASATVDLHHRLQQPGSPAPRHLSDFMTDVVDMTVGKARIPTMSRINAALVSCISLTKAFIRYEPAAGYMCDLSAALLAMSREERMALTARARRQGLINTLRFGILCAREILFLPQLDGLPSGLQSAHLSLQDLPAMLFTPLSPDLRRPKLRHFLWDLCDSSGKAGKAGTYMFEALNKIAARACQDIYKMKQAA